MVIRLIQFESVESMMKESMVNQFSTYSIVFFSQTTPCQAEDQDSSRAFDAGNEVRFDCHWQEGGGGDWIYEENRSRIDQ